MRAILILSMLFFIAFADVFGKPNANTLQDFELMYSKRTKRQLGDAIDLAIKYGSQATENASKCAENAGCHNGYCWTWCGLSLSGGDWCYTTRSYSQSFQYVKCSHAGECDRCWKCAGSCTL